MVNIFKKSFKLDKRYMMVIFLDLSFYLLLATSLAIWSKAVGNWLPNIKGLESLSIAGAQAMVNNFMFSLIAYTIALFIIIFLCYSLFKGIIWAKIIGKKYNFKLFQKFTLLNLIGFILFSVLVIILGLITKSISGQEFKPLMPFVALTNLISYHPYFSLIFLLLVLHIAAVLQIYFIQNPGFGAVKKTLLSFKKFHLYLYNYIFALIPLIIISLIGFLLKYIPVTIANIVSIILLISFITWLRFYLYSVVKSL